MHVDKGTAVLMILIGAAVALGVEWWMASPDLNLGWRDLVDREWHHLARAGIIVASAALVTAGLLRRRR
ncbi:hypothetical protein [Caulobacter sp. 17J65-9]|uniref:hypothetical protein n=1 Tax=Caulobacter sp. 17J65-9 TaxID=2709382 RepID=UPI0013C7D34E|nr:hypothetical protein [Caulobacter sp. 17J65-9]NEX94240.1 hypothetical protein [Caulobacter sp. 17J65-9]